MPVGPVVVYKLGGLQPCMYPHLADTQAIRIMPSLTALPQGAILAESQLSQNAVHTLAATGATAGAFTMTWRGFTTSIEPYNVTAAALQSALTGLASIGAGGVTCTGGPLNAATIVITWGGNFADLPIELPTLTITTAFATTNLTLVSTTVGQSYGFYGPYISGGANGLGTPQLVNLYLLSTDAAGNITFGSAPTGEEFLQTRLTAPAFSSGYFRIEDLPLAPITGISGGYLDANAVASTSSFCRIIEGSLSNGAGILRLL